MMNKWMMQAAAYTLTALLVVTSATPAVAAPNPIKSSRLRRVPRLAQEAAGPAKGKKKAPAKKAAAKKAPAKKAAAGDAEPAKKPAAKKAAAPKAAAKKAPAKKAPAKKAAAE
jgi:hypothetical protein